MLTLETLPLELQHHLLSFLDLPRPLKARDHAYLALSRVSRTLNAAVESYCRHRLVRLSARFVPGPKVSARPKNTRRRYLRYTAGRCRFCNRPTSASSKLFTFIPCCAPCDRMQWPEKITLTTAKKTYGLKEEQLTAGCHFGAYYCHNIYTRMFHEPDVRRLAQRVHGDLDAFFAKKEARRAKRRARQLATTHS